MRRYSAPARDHTSPTRVVCSSPRCGNRGRRGIHCDQRRRRGGCFVESVEDEYGGPNYFVSLMIAIALLLPWSVVRLVKGLRRRGESYMMHEQGFVHHAPARDEVVRWSNGAVVHQAGEEKSSGLLLALALDYRCRVV